MKITRLIVLTSLFLNLGLLHSQKTHQLSFQESFNTVKQQSFRMQEAKLELKIAERYKDATLGTLKTNISYDLSADYGKNARFSNQYNAQSIDNYVTYHNLQIHEGFNISQPLSTGGSIEISTGTSLYRSKTKEGDYNNASIYIDPTITFYQPIEPLFVINRYKYTRERARLNFEQAEKRYKQEEYYTRYRLSIAFYNLAYSLEMQNIYTEIIKNKTNIIKELKKTQSPQDYKKFEINLKQTINEARIANTKYIDNHNTLKELLNIPHNDSIALIYQFQTEQSLLSKEELIPYALDNRWDLKILANYKDQRNLELSRIKAYPLPEGGIKARFRPYGRSEQNDPISYNELFSNSIENSVTRMSKLNDLSIGFTLGIPIIDGREAKNNYKRQQLEVESIELRELEAEEEIKKRISSLVDQSNETYNRISLLDENLVLANENLKLSTTAFRENNINIYLYELDIRKWEEAYLDKLYADFNYQSLINQLSYETQSVIK